MILDWIYLVIIFVVLICFFYRYSKLDLDGSLFSGAQESMYYRHDRFGRRFVMPRNNDPSLNIKNIYKEAYMETKALEYKSENQITDQEEVKSESTEIPVLKMDKIEDNNLIEENKDPIVEKELIDNIKLSEERQVDL